MKSARIEFAYCLTSILPAVLLVVVVAGVPLNAILSVGGDDGFELCKAQLFARNPALAAQMWNDQPWGFTMLVGWLFRFVGEHAIIARLLSLVSTIALLLALGALVRHIATPAVVFATGLLLLTADTLPNLALAAMCELPAFSWAIVAVAIMYRGGGKPGWCLCSGAILACAVHIKVTAIMVGPALVAMMLSGFGCRKYMMVCTLWMISGFVLVFVLITLISPAFDVDQILGSHFQSALAAAGGVGNVFRMRPAWLLESPGLVLATVLGLLHPAFRKRDPVMIFGATLLLTAIGIAAVHRPWWRYYMVHFHIPMAVLAAPGIGMVLRPIIETLFGPWRRVLGLEKSSTPGRIEEIPPHDGSRIGTCVVIGCAGIALWAGFSLNRAVNAVSDLRRAPVWQDSRICQFMRQSGAEWVFTEQRDMAFHGQVLIPPELVVVSRKRFLSGSIDEMELLRLVMTYSPEILVLRTDLELKKAGWAEWVTNRYTLAEKEQGRELWVSRELFPYVSTLEEKRLDALGL